MKSFWLIFFFCSLYSSIVCPVIPPAKEQPQENNDHHEAPSDDDLGLEYGRYLQEVVSALEQDKAFAAKLENASSDAIKSGAIADQLDFVDHRVRSKLDELKRLEIDRLHALTTKEKKLKDEEEHQHLDKKNPHSFEVEDLHRLILKATADLEALDVKRRAEFKEYEMKKELEFRAKLAQETDDAVRQKLISEHEERQKRHDSAARTVNHPGSRRQLESVWETQDHLAKNEFDPKVFFSLHDVNNDGYLDSNEVEALLSSEVQKMYSSPDDDPREAAEELHRMREHIYHESDKDKDGLISKREFLEMAAKSDEEQQQQQESWKEIGNAKNAPLYDEAQLNAYYERLHQQRLMMNQQQGMHAQQLNPNDYYYYEHAPPPVNYYDPRSGHPIVTQHHGQPMMQQGYQYHDNQQRQQQQAYYAAGQPLVSQQQHHQANNLNQGYHPNVNQQASHQQQPEQLTHFNGQVYHLPAEQQQHQQQPMMGHQQQPMMGHQQQPMMGQQQQPMMGQQQQPMMGQQPQQKIGSFPPSAAPPSLISEKPQQNNQKSTVG